MDKLKYIRVQNKDGTFGNKIPVAVDSNNIIMFDGDTLQNFANDIENDLGQITEEIKGSHTGQNGKVYQNLKEHLNDISAQIENEKILTLVISNEVHIIPTDENGAGGDFSHCFSNIIVYYGEQDITDSEDIVWDVNIPDNILALWDEESYKITIKNMVNDSAVISIHITYKNKESQKKIIVKKVKGGKTPIVVEIESSAGNIFKNGGINTTLKAIVKRGGEDISSSVTNFHWIKYNQNGERDLNWSKTNSQTIQLTSLDFTNKAIFICEVTIN